ncbi:MAG TPA: OmpA family protein, partial [Saprospiraceae bacterium]|nr:OmpA family protein [Saprospiraceae bacterium]
MQKILLPVLFLLAITLLPAQSPTTVSVFFELDKYELSAEARQTLDALAPQLLAAPDYAVNIEAWTDDQGTQEYNLRLAANRADAVQRYLAGKGLLLDKTSVRNWGEQNAGNQNGTEESRRKNRRVDVAVTSYLFSDYTALQNRLAANTEQVLTVQPDKEQTFTAANGTLIVVPANSFVFEDGTSPTGPVELIVREAFSPSDFILHNLTTTSDGKVLQTGGMVYLGAQAAGKPLTMADGAALTVALPTGKVDPGMELFYGQTNPDNSINWQQARQPFRQQLKNPRVELDIDPALSARIMALKVPVYPEPALPKFAGQLPPEPRK